MNLADKRMKTTPTNFYITTNDQYVAFRIFVAVLRDKLN